MVLTGIVAIGWSSRPLLLSISSEEVGMKESIAKGSEEGRGVMKQHDSDEGLVLGSMH
jgi:hypothetical protein